MSDIDEVKSKIDIVEYIGKKVQLKKAGRSFKGLCPFHNEKTPSFWVSPERQVFHCFGCGIGGSVIDFLMEYEHLEFSEALEELARLAGVTLERRIPASPEGQIKQKIYEVNHLASEFFHYILTKHALGEKARLYLKERGVSDKTIKTFLLGYSPNSWEGLFRYLQKKGYDEALLEKSGLVIRSQVTRTSNRFYDRFRGRVMFTLRDHRGNVVGFAGRVLDPKTKEAKYINTPETPVYSKSNVLYGLDITRDFIQKENEAILMEGEMDVISSFQAGIPNVVAIKGSALTEGHVHLLRRFTEKLVFALDSDVAGDAASRRGIEIADKAGFDMRIVRLASGKDPDEAARENPSLLKKAIKEAIPVYDYFLESALKRHAVATPFGKKKIGQELLPVLAKIENLIVRGHYIRELSRVLEVPEETIHEGIKKLDKSVYALSVPEEQEPQVLLSSRPEKLEAYTLAFILQGRTIEFFEELLEGVALSQFTQPVIRQILQRLGEYIKDHRVFLIKDFADTLPPELTLTLDEAFLWDLSVFLDNEEKMALEWAKALRELRKMMLRKEIKELTSQIAVLLKTKSESDEDITALQNSLKERGNLLKALE